MRAPHLRRLLGLLSLAAFVLSVPGCGAWAAVVDVPPILCTTGFIADTVRNIAEPEVRVGALMGPGVDPHLYSPTQRDVFRLAQAEVILYNGLHLEGQMGKVLEVLGRRKPVYALSEGIPKDRLRPAGPGSSAYDPHIWFDVGLWAQTVGPVAEVLGRVFPHYTELFRERAKAYGARLLELDEWVEKEIQSIPAERRVLITAHDAFGYFGRRYGIEVMGLQGVSTMAEPSLEDIRHLVEVIVTRRVKAIFVETSVPRRAIEAVQAACAARGHHVAIGGSLYSDALGPEGSGAETYIGMVQHNVRTIVDALR
jgi:manganese/zinc/iron transport system substrate-binding protein